MVDKNQLFKVLGEDFAKVVREYHKAERESELETGGIFGSDVSREDEYNEHHARVKTLTTSKYYIKLTREEYWQNIIKAKIEVIACIGGFKLMQEFCIYLYNHPLDDELKLYRTFDYYADGIGGWST